MIKSSSLLKFFVLIIFVLMVSGCTEKPSDNSLNEIGDFGQESALEDKNQEFTMTGKISKSGNLYLLTPSSGKVQDLESYTVDFDKYLGKTVSVTGEYSGNTLFVTQIN